MRWTMTGHNRLREFVVLAAALLLGSANRAEACKSSCCWPESIAHCWCRVEDSGGRIIKDLGEVGAYCSLTPENGNHQDRCVQDCDNEWSKFLDDKGQMCHEFLA